MDTGRIQSPPVVSDDDDTSPGSCVVCCARANVEAALVRAGVMQVTTVVRYERPRVGEAPRERSRALLSFPHGIVVGEGESREEALFSALQNAGVTL